MKFCITENMITDLCRLCQNSSFEQCGSMNFKKENNEFYLQDYNLCDAEEIKFRDEKSVFLTQEYIKKIILDFYSLKEFEGVIVRFHTHPMANDLAYPSPQDKKFVRHMQSIIDVIDKHLQKDFIYVEGIITSEEIGFYYLNKINNKIERVKVFTENREIIPKKWGIIKDIPQIFYDGFKEGFKKGYKR